MYFARKVLETYCTVVNKIPIATGASRIYTTGNSLHEIFMVKKINKHKKNLNRRLAATVVVALFFTAFLVLLNSTRSSQRVTPIDSPAPTNIASYNLDSGKTFTSPVMRDFGAITRKDVNQKISFTLTVPEGWSGQVAGMDNQLYTFSLKKDNFTIHLSMPETYDGSGCNYLYPSQSNNEYGMYYAYYDEVNTNFGKIRMSRGELNSYPENIEFYGCQMLGADRNWSSITRVGLIQFSIPADKYSSVVVKEMENILKLIKLTNIE